MEGGGAALSCLGSGAAAASCLGTAPLCIAAGVGAGDGADAAGVRLLARDSAGTGALRSRAEVHSSTAPGAGFSLKTTLLPFLGDAPGPR